MNGRQSSGGSGPSGELPEDHFALVLRRVAGGNGFEETLARLLRVIRLGLVPPGARLPAERVLAARLGVGRGTVREALRVLGEQELVEVRRGRGGGSFVRAAGAGAAVAVEGGGGGGGLDDLLLFREVLETGAAGLCARRGLTGADADRLREALAGTGVASPAGYRRADTLLHLALAELSGSPSLAVRYAEVRARLNAALDGIPVLSRNIEHSQAQHERVVRAVLLRDTRGAESAMREHCAGTAALLRGFLG